MKKTNWSLVGAVVILAALIVAIYSAHARDMGQWNSNDTITQWYQELMQPDVPTASCCGESDAYWCDDYYSRDDKAFCKITDDRADAPRGRPHLAMGTEFEIPPNKLKFDKGNPTGHALLFVSRGAYVFCFVQPGGV